MSESRQFCTFLLDSHCFGIPVELVREVIRCLAVTSVPLAPRDVIGLINLRGQIVMVIDLRCRLNLSDRKPQQEATHVIVQAGNEIVSFLVDGLCDVRDVNPSQYESTPETLQGDARELIMGTYKLPEKLLLALDVARVAKVGENVMSESL